MSKKKQTLLFTGPEPIIRIVLIGTLVVISLMTLVLISSIVLIGNYYVLPRLYVAFIVLMYLVSAAYFYKQKQHRVTAWMLLVFYTLLGVMIVALWSINSAIGMLILGFTILLAGIMLGARYILWATIGMTLILLLLQIAVEYDILHPDAHSLSLQSTFLDVTSYVILFILYAVISWLAGRRSEQLLSKSKKAEDALRKEKALLNVRLEQKTREVREAQLEEMQQLYKLAELGQLGTVLLHDLANNLTSLTLDIDDLGRQLQRNETITRAKESISYLETMVSGVRNQINQTNKTVAFDVLGAISETVAILGPKARRATVIIENIILTKHSFIVDGDLVRFTHVITILISNAIDAYKNTEAIDRKVIIKSQVYDNALIISISNKGKKLSRKRSTTSSNPLYPTNQKVWG